MYITAICSCQFHSTKSTQQGLVTTPIILGVYQCYLLMSFSFNQTNKVRTGNHSHQPWCIWSVLSISVMTVLYHTQNLSNSFSMPLPKEDPWSWSDVLGLLDESESNFSSLASPQGLLKNNSSTLNNSKHGSVLRSNAGKLDLMKGQFTCCMVYHS